MFKMTDNINKDIDREWGVKMNDIEKEAYDLMKDPEKYDYDILFATAYGKYGDIFVCFRESGNIGITFVLNEKKELKRVDFFEYSKNLEYIVFKINERQNIKELFEELWQEYIKKYNLRIKLLFVC